VKGMAGKDVKRVIGLKYEPQQGPPKVVLKSVGATADKVVETARALQGGPVLVRNEGLLERLYHLPVDAPIDAQLFQLVAILLVHVYSVDAEMEEQVVTRKGEICRQR